MPAGPILTVSNRLRSTPYTSRNEALGVKAYTVYNNMLLPTCFRSDEEDYWHLCEHVQIWDVSCERQIQIAGADASRLVQWMTPRDISKAQTDQCFYLPLCDELGKMINDPVAIKVRPDRWWLSIADSDVLLWAKGLAQGGDFEVNVDEIDVWPIAVQGPKAEILMARVFGDQVNGIRFFRYKWLDFMGHPFIVARSGWSKQGGFEIYVDDAALGQRLWDVFFEHGADLIVGPGCPNLIERVESGLLSFGNDMYFNHTPLQCGLEKFCDLHADIESMSIQALRAHKAQGVSPRLMGIVGRGLCSLPDEQGVYSGNKQVGQITSQCLSAKYDAYLGFAMLEKVPIMEAVNKPGEALTVIVGKQPTAVSCHAIPFDFKTLDLGLRQRESC